MESCDPALLLFFFLRYGTICNNALALVSIVGTYCYINFWFFCSSLVVTGAVLSPFSFEKSIDYKAEGLISGSSFIVRILSMLI